MQTGQTLSRSCVYTCIVCVNLTNLLNNFVVVENWLNNLRRSCA